MVDKQHFRDMSTRTLGKIKARLSVEISYSIYRPDQPGCSAGISIWCPRCSILTKKWKERVSDSATKYRNAEVKSQVNPKSRGNDRQYCR